MKKLGIISYFICANLFIFSIVRERNPLHFFEIFFLSFLATNFYLYRSYGIFNILLFFHKKIENDPIKGISKERLFFHDLINHTHGLNLFLNQRLSLKKGLSVEETQSVYEELRLMQSLVKDHYGHPHKNLSNTYDVVDFEFAKRGFELLTKTYLSSKVKIETSFKGPFDDCFIYYPSFHRIMTNLIKNISETRTMSVRFSFDNKIEGLFFEVRNTFLVLENSEKALSKVILEEKINLLPSCGLESINRLCKDEGGYFDFFIENGEWVSKIFLPHPQKMNNAPKAA